MTPMTMDDQERVILLVTELAMNKARLDTLRKTDPDLFAFLDDTWVKVIEPRYQEIAEREHLLPMEC